MKIGGKIASITAKELFNKETIEALKKIGNKLDIKIFQRSIAKYVFTSDINRHWNLLELYMN